MPLQRAPAGTERRIMITYETSTQNSIGREATSYLTSIGVHSLLLLLFLFVFPALVGKSGGGGGNGMHTGIVSLDMPGNPGDVAQVQQGDVMERAEPENIESQPVPAETEVRTSRAPDAIKVPETRIAKPAETRPAASAPVEKLESLKPRQAQGSSTGNGSDRPGSGTGDGVGTGAGSGSDKGVGSGSGNGAGNSDGDGTSFAFLPSSSFNFQQDLECGKDDANRGSAVRYKIEYDSKEGAPKVTVESGGRASSKTNENARRLIQQSFSAAFVKPGTKHTVFTGTVVCRCGTSQCELESR